MIVAAFDEEVFARLKSDDQSAHQRREMFDVCIVENEMESSLQREIVVDTLFAAVEYCIENGLSYEIADLLINFMEETIEDMISRKFDSRLSSQLRVQQTLERMNHMVEENGVDFMTVDDWKKLCVFLCENFLRDLDLLNFAVTNMATTVEREIDLVVDTPIAPTGPLVPDVSHLAEEKVADHVEVHS